MEVMAHRRYEEAAFSEDCSDGETLLDSSEEDEYDSAEDSAGSLADYFIADEDEPLLVTPPSFGSKNKGRINNISDDDDVVFTFLLSFLQCVKLEYLNLKWE
jgi:hypothetical protein